MRPHAPTSICGAPVSYDANGNTLAYDRDGTGPGLPARGPLLTQLPRVQRAVKRHWRFT